MFIALATCHLTLDSSSKSSSQTQIALSIQGQCSLSQQETFRTRVLDPSSSSSTKFDRAVTHLCSQETTTMTTMTTLKPYRKIKKKTRCFDPKFACYLHTYTTPMEQVDDSLWAILRSLRHFLCGGPFPASFSIFPFLFKHFQIIIAK